ncbi:phosphatase PAP2 family protein [Stenotrophomonas sp. YIM B06876]|uniref:phosphatase PAP2 family protein n=1 Tax=Stenotrophomonas sp. YIM B06876 TaxID=3060211 RepID=UPI002739D68C|nr:phosphatase PAP2 family protein [Stenotrophomonas sp. YIM B06876]
MKWDWQWLIAPGSALWIFPMSLALGLALLATRQPWRPVLHWWLALAVASAITAASKIAFYAWGTGIRAWDLTCFSGHTVLALSGWPVAAALLAPPTRPRLRVALTVSGIAFALLIGFSRVELRAHPWSEVIAGALLGGAVAAYALRTLRNHHLPISVSITLLIAALATSQLVPSHNYSKLLRTEDWFAQIGKTFSGSDKPVNRQQWRTAGQHDSRTNR